MADLRLHLFIGLLVCYPYLALTFERPLMPTNSNESLHVDQLWTLFHCAFPILVVLNH
jgi:hypothetical protein